MGVIRVAGRGRGSKGLRRRLLFIISGGEWMVGATGKGGRGVVRERPATSRQIKF